jgi:uncharacterized protein (TIGR02118 family)
MIKLVTFQKRVPALTRSEFEQRWLTVHGPMAALFPGLRGYMLGFSLEDGEPPADGVAQLWFDSRLACQESYATEIGRSGSRDASAYLARREHLLASETWLTAPVPNAFRHKLLICAKRAEGQGRADFVAWWRAEGTEALREVAGAPWARLSVDEAGQLLNSRSDGPLGLAEGEGVHDGLLEQWWDSAEALRDGAARLTASPVWAALQRATSRTERGLLQEHVVVPLKEIPA